jgi:hypothetical protein
VTTKSGHPAEVAISGATTDSGERIFIVRVLSGALTSLTEIAAWEVPAAKVETMKVDPEATKVAVDHISHIVADPMEGLPVPDESPSR